MRIHTTGFLFFKQLYYAEMQILIMYDTLVYLYLRRHDAFDFVYAFGKNTTPYITQIK